MAEPKTKKNRASVKAFIDGIKDEKKRADSRKVAKLLKEITGETAVMWGDSIIGYGSYHYKYASGREGDWPLTGFSPRKQALTLYIMAGFDRYDEILSRLGKHKHGKSCLYVKKLDDIDLDVLRELVTASIEHLASQRT